MRGDHVDHVDLVDYGRVEGGEILGGNPIFQVLLPAGLLDLVAAPGNPSERGNRVT
jgi:hypothetical protein